MATSKPSRAASVAAAAPIPRLAPVIRTTGEVFAIQPPRIDMLCTHYDACEVQGTARNRWPFFSTGSPPAWQSVRSACVKHDLCKQHDQDNVDEYADVYALRGARAQTPQAVQSHGGEEMPEDAECEHYLDEEQQAEVTGHRCRKCRAVKPGQTEACAKQK